MAHSKKIQANPASARPYPAMNQKSVDNAARTWSTTAGSGDPPP
ncbi:hypothetical protein [Mycobacterium sp. 1081908.1]|nr:hypothetical protein [Mycobacterium sp. 1081908.1]